MGHGLVCAVGHIQHTYIKTSCSPFSLHLCKDLFFTFVSIANIAWTLFGFF